MNQTECMFREGSTASTRFFFKSFSWIFLFMPETPSFSADVAGKQIYVSDLRAKDVVRTTFLVRHKAVQYSKNGKAYVALVLADRTGTIEGRIWEDAARLAETFSD